MRFHILILGFLTSLACLGGCELGTQTPLQRAERSFRRGEWPQAVDACTEVLSRQPKDVKALLLRGRALACLTEYEQAIADYTAVIALQPDDPEAYYHREIGYRKLGQEALAVADHERARNLDPLHKSAYQFEHANFVSLPELALSDQPPPADDDALSNAPQEPESTAGDAKPAADAEEFGLPPEPTSQHLTRSAETVTSEANQSVSGPSRGQTDSVAPRSFPHLPRTPVESQRTRPGPSERGHSQPPQGQVAVEKPEAPPRSSEVQEPAATPPRPRLSTALPTGANGQLLIPHQWHGNTQPRSRGVSLAPPTFDPLLGPTAPTRKGMVGKLHANPVYNPRGNKRQILSTSRTPPAAGNPPSAQPSQPILSTQLPENFVPQNRARATGIRRDPVK